MRGAPTVVIGMVVLGMLFLGAQLFLTGNPYDEDVARELTAAVPEPDRDDPRPKAAEATPAAAAPNLLSSEQIAARLHSLVPPRDIDLLSVEDSSALLGRILRTGEPAAIGKLGSVEQRALDEVLRPFKRRPSRETDVEWSLFMSKNRRKNLFVNAGVFPNTTDVFDKWARLFLGTLPHMDVLAPWFKTDRSLVYTNFVAEKLSCISLTTLQWNLLAEPWGQWLRDKRVLVLTAIPDSIRHQYENHREQLFDDPRILPRFRTLETIRVPYAPAVEPSMAGKYADWFAALEHMQAQMAATEFDVALVAAGAYSLPLVTYAKALGKIGIHTGGGTQILFGVRGKRWDSREEFVAQFNEHWIHPLPHEVPELAHLVEGGAYW